MKLIRVKPSQIKVPELRVTARFDEELLANFKNSIKEVGQITPPIVYEVEGELILCDGLHRLQEALDNGDSPIDVCVIPGDMIDVLTKNIFLDHLRGKTPVSEMVRVIGALNLEYGLDSDKIVEKTGLTRDYIEKLLKISLASPSVQQALDEGVIGVGIAYELSRLPYPEQQEEIIAKHQIWRYKVAEIKEQIDLVLRAMQDAKEQPEPIKPGEPRPAPVYHCEGCKVEIDPRYLRAAMICPECFGEIWRLQKAKERAKAEKSED